MPTVISMSGAQWEQARIAIPAHAMMPFFLAWAPPSPGLFIEGLRFSEPTVIGQITIAHRIVAINDTKVHEANADSVDWLWGHVTEWRPACVKGHVLRIGERLEVTVLTPFTSVGWVDLLHQMIDVAKPRQPKPTLGRTPLDEITPPSVRLPSAAELRREKHIAECRRTLESRAPRRFEDERFGLRAAMPDTSGKSSTRMPESFARLGSLQARAPSGTRITLWMLR